MLTTMSCSFTRVEKGREKEQLMCLENLPTDALLAIFEFCNIVSLLNLSQTCRRFNCIIKDDVLWYERSKSLNMTNQVSDKIKSRSFYILPHIERCRISRNWNSGRYIEKVFLNQKTKYMPWIQLESEVLWMSRGPQILALKRKDNSIGIVPTLILDTQQRDDVSRFVVKSGRVISGGRDGSLYLWSASHGSLLFHEARIHSSDVTDVDYSSNCLVVTGSKDKTIKVWNTRDDIMQLVMSVLVDDRVWTLALEPSAGNILSFGTSGHNLSKCPLSVYDVERCQMLSLVGPQHKYGAGILDVLWEDPCTILSCGYDGSFRMWDTRVGKCIRRWMDPLDGVLYCLASDHNFSILCGSAQHGRVQMWDKRQSKSLQMYFMSCTHSSPVYSLSFDPSHLFAALDQSLNMMDFSGFCMKAMDYRENLIF